MTIKTLLVDDEYLALNLLETFAGKLPELEVVGKCKSPVQAMEVLGREAVDLLFLDIQMPTVSGINLLKSLPQAPVTIFTTAYADYAVDAFNLNAVDYLLKPFSFERFLQAVQKAREHPQLRPSTLVIPKESKDFFTIKVDGKLTKVRFEDILFVEGLKEYVRIVCRDARLVTYERLSRLEEILPDNFLRVHKSYIISKDRVESLEGNRLVIGSHKIPISRDKKQQVVEKIFFD
ncbi:LytR/AlgR family response regulator transcription factor [Flavilitoribacter nigricans]|uniref:DNA-binding response regulator n=1 Tax=Flavilitoribacter nigricans (strain ATCC 23147 / DSM 23189 / NBRC 102662 / NCIMB 1420 / SS-2) TaxID=1122177 RepID=A0A2D0NA58_FLAN2|nr:LytTR family DNA-binding domain-containing protein [Flavilitoribacter nigricans]PHN05268.1 DNA-binding response regulator [Flavilitoribacter nigricans DSM 23189 = NBRC 102662]